MGMMKMVMRPVAVAGVTWAAERAMGRLFGTRLGYDRDGHRRGPGLKTALAVTAGTAAATAAMQTLIAYGAAKGARKAGRKLADKLT